MIILAIDTSFDDTAAAVVHDTHILSNVLSTQLSVHEQYGGIVPNLARESHKQYIDPVIAMALKKARCSIEQVDVIAVTQGPGLAITLEVGIAKAKELSATYNKPIVAINHMEGHFLSFLAKTSVPSFPLLGVLISGGHTQFVLANDIGSYEIVGETKDDAIGECFDKVGRMLGLGYPAGKIVEAFAKKGRDGKVVFPVPMRQVKDANTSYSGLKTAAMRIIEQKKIENGGTLTAMDICDIACGFQTAAITHLTEKLHTAISIVGSHKLHGIVLGGGVVANLSVRKQVRAVARSYNLPIYLPPTKKLCVDNAAMIGIAGLYKAQRKEFIDPNSFDRIPNLHL